VCVCVCVCFRFYYPGEANAPQRSTIPLDDVDQFPLSVIPLLVPPLLSLEESLGRKKSPTHRPTDYKLSPNTNTSKKWSWDYGIKAWSACDGDFIAGTAALL